ncbi:MAG: dihydrolipoyl dehydrogenase [Oligoflexales bacterium]|nr:dihydrolipoyl dehydrogenase [Oligoflexales bacterium]
MNSVSDSYDVIVIGAGPGGYVCAIRAAQLGFRTACVEASETLGGTCLNVGCIPSKALLESSHHYHKAGHEFSEHGIKLDRLSIDVPQMLKRKEAVVSSITDGVAGLFKKNKVKWLKGHGSIAGPGLVTVTSKDGKNETFAGKHVVIATGSIPIQIPPAKFDHKQIVDSTDALSFKAVPEELLVVGGGVIGLELGSVWLRLGSKVTVIEAQNKILGATDAGVSREMLKILKKQGMNIQLSTMLESTEIVDGKVKMTCKQKDQSVEFQGDKALIAVGRRPLTDQVGLEKVGIKADSRGFIEVDKHYKTSVDGFYAIGDTIHGPMLAHKAEEEGIALAEMLAGKAGHVNYEAIASVVYTWPELASIGLTEEECKEQGIPFKTGKFYFKANGRAKAMNETQGFVKCLAHKESDRLLGVHIIGPTASELAAEAALAFEYGASAEDIARSVHAHPTLAEAMKEAALDVDKRAIHS